MRWIRDRPLGQKMVVAMVLASGLVFIVASVGFTVYAVGEFRRSTAAGISSLAHTLGANSAAALAWGDTSAATRLVESVSGQPFIANACLYVADGSLLAEFRQDTAAPCPVNSGTFSAIADAYLTQQYEVVYEDFLAGSIGLIGTQQELLATLQDTLGIVFLVIVAAVIATWGLALGLQRVVSGPVLHLGPPTGRRLVVRVTRSALAE